MIPSMTTIDSQTLSPRFTYDDENSRLYTNISTTPRRAPRATRHLEHMYSDTKPLNNSPQCAMTSKMCSALVALDSPSTFSTAASTGSSSDDDMYSPCSRRRRNWSRRSKLSLGSRAAVAATTTETTTTTTTRTPRVGYLFASMYRQKVGTPKENNALVSQSHLPEIPDLSLDDDSSVTSRV